MTSHAPLHLFEAVGIEIEYMIVDQSSLNIRPIADELFRAVLGEYGSDVESDLISWSNELVAHVVELKTTLPVKSIEDALHPFEREVERINDLLDPMKARLLPSAMHPWMNPRTEMKLWPHDNNEIYSSFDRIFGCQGHGWSNLQSMHLNLPFHGDDEFARLHTAIRTILPLIPALAASSPFEEGNQTGFLDNRMKHYGRNSAILPNIAGQVVPEPVTSEEEYREKIFVPMFREIAPHDPEEMMREEWLNARGAIARFSRGSIEIRVVDSQEIPRSDLAVAAAIVAVVRSLTEEAWSSSTSQLALPQEQLVSHLKQTIETGPAAVINDEGYLRALGMEQTTSTAGDVWKHLVQERMGKKDGIHDQWTEPLDAILNEGPLATRLIDATHGLDSRFALRSAYMLLADSLDANELFVADE